jgi:hypothetical protein
MFRRSFVAANIFKVVLLATVVVISAGSDPRLQMVADVSNQTVSVVDPPAHREGPPVSHWDPSESSVPRAGVYYDP